MLLFRNRRKNHLNHFQLNHFIQLYEKYGKKAISKETTKREYSREGKNKDNEEIRSTLRHIHKLKLKMSNFLEKFKNKFLFTIHLFLKV